MIRFLFDEHLSPGYAVQLTTRRPGLVVRVVGQGEAPVKETTDSDILRWCEAHGFVLVTNNRKSMPRHLADHLTQGRHVPGILTIRLKVGFGRLIQELADIADNAADDDFVDRIIYIP